MGEEKDTFRLSKSAEGLAIGFAVEARALGARITDALVEEGEGTSEAGSVAAHILVTAAWIVAGVAKLAGGGGLPDPEKFIAAARYSIDRIDLVGLVDAVAAADAELEL